jgi:hypothetical protein
MQARLGFGLPSRRGRTLEQFREKCAALFRPKLRKNKELERFHVSASNGNAPGKGSCLDHHVLPSTQQKSFPPRSISFPPE